MGINDTGTFVMAVVLFLMLPGPGTFTLLAATGRGGVRAGYATLAGLMLGDQLLIAAAATGVAALLQAHPALFAALRYVGAGYLAWVGVQLLREPAAAGPVAPPPRQGRRWFRQALLVGVLNPKAILFYMAFFPLFIDPATQRGVATLATMAALIALLSIAWCSLLIFGGRLIARLLAGHPRLGAWLRRGVGVCLIGFGLRLGLEA
ncbi:leucine efflux protein LeuE [Stenotrophomonas sp. MMGLT7]|uniref:leucine efflux protein LeuE n=1 Tax=Stenotrophomonas sp. MMGLT7 TaxID=2901227 RepID=UPI001E6596CC|nr:leucine efflux protein LeuE [Stenotrophomonas sp. MMGLT7]MCD7098457.1 leucine efflux protein LeuE [Stenotrophomonas sp. MMGLT7]